MNKKTITTFFCLMSVLGFSQVAIGKTGISSPSVSLEFGVGNKGIVIPWVNGASNISFTTDTSLQKGGVLILDTTDKKVKISSDNGNWRDLTVHTNEAGAQGNKEIDTSLQDNPAYPEQTIAKAMIGGDPNTDTTPGILVLADTNKAMVLPKVASPHLNIKNPAPGMIAYDTTARQLAVYNGTVWSFWKP